MDSAVARVSGNVQHTFMLPIMLIYTRLKLLFTFIKLQPAEDYVS